jgi:Tfp pilus assembly protein PilF
LYQNPKAHAEYLAGKNIAPRINECEPGQNWTSFMDALHRGQYGPQTLFPRKTQLSTGYNVVQGYFWQMAMFVRYLSQQPLPEDVNPVFRFFILFAFYAAGLGGMCLLFRRDKKLFTMLALTLFMLSFAIVGYLNMKFSPSDSDPKHQDREVRERDYFFHTGFTYFGMFMGIGAFGAAEWLGRRPRFGPALRSGVLAAAAAFAIVPIATNFRITSRFGNFIPKDYGYNMLISCDDNSLIFTNGDNDTFPLWFAQEVLGLKRDVLVANLSLINTDWYIRQLKYWGAPISFSDYVIKRLQPVAVGNHYVLVKDIMIREIMAANAGIRLKEEDYFSPQENFAAKYLKGYRGKRTIYFSSTVSEDNFKGFTPYLRLEGLVYRLVGDSIAPPRNINQARTQDLFYRVYRYTGVFDPPQQKVLADIIPDFSARKKQGEFYDFALPKDENTRRLYTNYAAGLFALGLYLRDQNDYPAAEQAWRFALAFQPDPDYPFLYNLGILFAQQGRPDSAVTYLAQIETREPQLLTQIGSAFGILGAYDRAVTTLNRAIRINPRFAPAYSALVSVYINQSDRSSAIRVLGDWLRLNPQDSVAYNMMKELEKQ